MTYLNALTAPLSIMSLFPSNTENTPWKVFYTPFGSKPGMRYLYYNVPWVPPVLPCGRSPSAPPFSCAGTL